MMTFKNSGILVLLAVTAAGCGTPTTDKGNGNTPSSGGTSGGVGTGGTGTGGGSGGVTAAGGNATGGAVSGGAAGTVASGGSGGQVTTVTCTFNVTPSLSTNIPTVGIVDFSTDLPAIDRARIEFGLDTTYGMTAPVDLAEPGYRTLLLGMKGSSTYHFRVVAGSGANECTSTDFTVDTGAISNELPDITINTTPGAALAGGFMITGTYQGGPAYILDADGDYVWWYGTGEMTRARMSYDGKHMWIAKGNVPEGQAKVVRVSMDGSDAEDLSDEFEGMNHDLVVLPDETVIFIAYDNGCDRIVERSPTGETHDIITARTALGLDANEDCHCNALQYSREDDTIIFSELDHDSYVKVARNGEVVWVLGGAASEFTGDGASWENQHGLDILALNRLLIFNNGPMGQGGGSRAIEIELDLGGMTATRRWEYFAGSDLANAIMGDVQRLWNGNTLVAYSQLGIVHEVNAAQELLREMEWSIGGAIGYINKRQSLYGPPPSHFQP